MPFEFGWSIWQLYKYSYQILTLHHGRIRGGRFNSTGAPSGCEACHRPPRIVIMNSQCESHRSHRVNRWSQLYSISPCLRPPCSLSNLNIPLPIAYLPRPRDVGPRAISPQAQLLYLERRHRRLGVASRTVSSSFFD